MSKTLLLLSTLVYSSFASTEPISLQSGIGKIFGKRFVTSQKLATLEQQVEDYNAHWVATAPDAVTACCKRRLICLPLDERFNPPMGVFSRDHVQTGDKMSVPRTFWTAIETAKAEVPWLMEVSRVEGVTLDRVEVSEEYTAAQLDKVVGGPLDFRAPSNYIFLPWWQMRALGLQPRDIVDVRLITTVPPGSAAQLRPHSSKFAKEIANPQAVLETELKHYSSLTRGSTIAFDYNGQRYWFDVVELRSGPRGEKSPMVKVQDCDIATEFLPAKDTRKGSPNQQK
jgi:Ubiquitin fusion degradation protein UFD1